MYRRIVATFALLLLSSCASPSISVQMDYLSKENLASYVVQTPDPLLNNPPIGERLIIQWFVPGSYLNYSNLHLEMTLRYRNNKEVMVQIPMNSRYGTYIYDLVNDHYYDVCGIMTYKIDMYGNDCLLLNWRHQLWADLIVFPDQAPCPPFVCPGVNPLIHIDEAMEFDTHDYQDNAVDPAYPASAGDPTYPVIKN